MSKRAAEPSPPAAARKNKTRDDVPSTQSAYPEGIGEFEDDFEDEYESDDEVLEAGVDGEAPPDDEHVDRMDEDEQVYIPSRRKLGKNEVLEPDPSTYHMLHQLNSSWPCLSFDVIRDELGDERRGYPQTVYLAAGTQAARAKDNEVMVVKMSGLGKMQQGKGEDSDDDEDGSDAEDDPILESRSLPCPSTTNRIRVSPHSRQAASMAESGDVYVWNLEPHFRSLESPGFAIAPAANKPQSVLKMHRRTEGYAIDWSPHPREVQGKIATGDNDGNIFISKAREDGSWITGDQPLRGHTGSVEELQWSPAERHVLASASSDGTVKIWDARSASRKPELSVEVSSSDVNVASWCRSVPHLLATGADDGVWAVWDMRTFGSTLQGNSVVATASFNFHKEPVTSVEFHPTEDSTVSVAAADNTVTLWDLAVEVDDEESRNTGGVEDIPPQLLFVHYAKDVKEVHWQKQAPGVVVSTGMEGFSVFKTISVV